MAVSSRLKKNERGQRRGRQKLHGRSGRKLLSKELYCSHPDIYRPAEKYARWSVIDFNKDRHVCSTDYALADDAYNGKGQ